MPVEYSSTYLLQRSVDGRNPLLHVFAFDRVNKVFELLQQQRFSLKVIVVELHPVTEDIEHPGGRGHRSYLYTFEIP